VFLSLLFGLDLDSSVVSKIGVTQTFLTT